MKHPSCPEKPVASCEDHRSPSSALDPLTSLATSASVLVLTISPLLAQTPLHFLWRQNICGLLWEAFHQTVNVSCKKQKPLPCAAHLLLALSQRLSPSAQHQGLGVPCPGVSAPLSRKGAPLLLFPSEVSLLPRPLPRRPCHSERAQQVTSSLHVTTWIK